MKMILLLFHRYFLIDLYKKTFIFSTTDPMDEEMMNRRSSNFDIENKTSRWEKDEKSDNI